MCANLLTARLPRHSSPPPRPHPPHSLQGLLLVALAVSRALNIYPLALITNCARPPNRAIPYKQQFMMWYSGLRGAMAFALSVMASEELGRPGEVRRGEGGLGVPTSSPSLAAYVSFLM